MLGLTHPVEGGIERKGVDFFTQEIPQQGDERNAEDGPGQIREYELPRVHPDGARNQVDGHPKPGKEASEEDGLSPVAVKINMNFRQAVTCQPAAKPGVVQDVRAPLAPQVEDHAIADNGSHDGDGNRQIQVCVAGPGEKSTEQQK